MKPFSSTNILWKDTFFLCIEGCWGWGARVRLHPMAVLSWGQAGVNSPGESREHWASGGLAPGQVIVHAYNQTDP